MQFYRNSRVFQLKKDDRTSAAVKWANVTAFSCSPAAARTVQCLTNGVRNRNKLFNLQLHGWFANHKNIEVSQTPEQTVKLINYHAPVQHQHFFSKYVSKQIPSSDRRIEFDLQQSTIKCLKDLLIAQLVTSYSLQLWSDMLAMFYNVLNGGWRV